MFYIYDQNNSGGSFDVDDKLCHRLFIEADNEHEAESKALGMGVYFDGVFNDMDCSCCGDRWYNMPDNVTYPLKYGEETFKNEIEHAQYLADRYGWTTPDIRIFYKDGTVKEIFKND